MANSALNFTNTTSSVPSGSKIWDFSLVTLPIKLNLQTKTLIIGQNAISFVDIPTQFFFKDDQIDLILPKVEQLSNAYEEFSVSLIGSISGAVAADSHLHRTSIDGSKLLATTSFYDYSTSQWKLGDQELGLSGINIIQVPINSQKNTAIINFELTEFCAAPGASNLAVVIDPRVILTSRMHFDNYAFLRLGGIYSAPTKGVTALMDYRSEIGLLDGTFLGSSLLSLSNGNDYFIGGKTSKPTTVLSSKGIDTLVSRNGKDLLSFWDDYQGASNAAFLPTIDVNLTTGKAIDGYGFTDLISGFNNIEGSYQNPMKITGNPNDNFFFLYGNKDFVDGKEGLDIICMDSWDLVFDLNRGVVTKQSGDAVANFNSIEGVIAQGKLDITGNDQANLIGFRYGRGGNISAGGGDDIVCFLDTLFGNSFSILIDGGEGKDSVYAYSRYSDANISITGIGSATIEFGTPYENYYSTSQQLDDFKIFNTVVSRGTGTLKSIELVYFLDGYLDLTTGKFIAGLQDFTIPNNLYSPFIDRNRASDEFSYPKSSLNFNLFDGIDTNVDQLTDKSILTGAGSDLVVCRFASEINTGSGDDQVAVFANKSNVILGKGNDIVAYSTYQNSSTLDGGDGFDIAIFMNRTEYLQSLANIVIKNIECIHIQDFGFKYDTGIDQKLTIPFLNIDKAISDPNFDEFIFKGNASRNGANLQFFANLDNTTYFQVKLTDGFINSDDSSTWKALDSIYFQKNLSIQSLKNETLICGQEGIEVLNLPTGTSHKSIGNNLFEFQLNNGTSVFASGIERLKFTDKSLAVDISGNAGTTAKILGAVFGKESVSNKSYVGIGLNFLDAGWSYDNLAGLALDAAGAKTNDQIVSLLWTNVIGTKPTAADKQPFIALLENGMTAGALAHLAADSSFNTTNINLVGLAQTGIEYMPVS
jgi:hypothetical protein